MHISLVKTSGNFISPTLSWSSLARIFFSLKLICLQSRFVRCSLWSRWPESCSFYLGKVALGAEVAQTSLPVPGAGKHACVLCPTCSTSTSVILLGCFFILLLHCVSENLLRCSQPLGTSVSPKNTEVSGPL